MTVVQHPLVAHRLGVLRASTTPPWLFRQMVAELTTLVATEATRDLDLVDTEVTTPVAPTTGQEIPPPGPLIIPILRAGVAMLDSVLRLIPQCDVGFFGTKRNEVTLEPTIYMNRMPESLARRHVIILDPMLATGGSLSVALNEITARGATSVTCLCLVGSRQGVTRIETEMHRLNLNGHLVIAAVDDNLTPAGFIDPGLGDAGDRLFGAY